MSRGGKREGAGGKPTWKNGKTKTIRVPVVLAEEILRIARELDEKGVIEHDTESKVLDLSGITVPEIRGKRFVFLSDLVRSGYEVYPLKWAEIARAELSLGMKKVANESKTDKKLK
jgi:hypothetical protein